MTTSTGDCGGTPISLGMTLSVPLMRGLPDPCAEWRLRRYPALFAVRGVSAGLSMLRFLPHTRIRRREGSKVERAANLVSGNKRAP